MYNKSAYVKQRPFDIRRDSVTDKTITSLLTFNSFLFPAPVQCACTCRVGLKKPRAFFTFWTVPLLVVSVL